MLLVSVASCEGATPAASVDPIGSYVRNDGASMTVARANSSAPNNYRLDLHQAAQSGGFVRPGQDCYVVVVGTLNGNELAGTSDMDEDNPGSISPANLKHGVDGPTLGMVVRFASNGASINDHAEGQFACGAPFSGVWRKSE